MRTFIAFFLMIGICANAVAQESTSVMTPFGQQRATGASGTTVTGGENSRTEAQCSDCVTKVFAIRYVDSRAILHLLEPFEIRYSYDVGLKAVSVKAPEKTMNAIEEVIKRFDVPANAPKQVEVTAYLILGSSQVEPDSAPAILKPVIDQLHGIMAYKSYRVLDTIMTTGKEGDRIAESGMTPKLNDSDPMGSQYNFSANPRVVTGEGTDRSVHFDNLQLTLTNVGKGTNGSIQTSVDIKKGQQVVIGKSTILDRAIILVLSAKIID